MKLTTWNVAGLRAFIRKNGWNWVIEHNPDVLCLQEIKANPDQITAEDYTLFAPYQSFWNPADRKGYSGTLTFVKDKTVKFNLTKSSSNFARKVFNTDAPNVNSTLTPAADLEYYWLGETFENDYSEFTGSTGAEPVGANQRHRNRQSYCEWRGVRKSDLRQRLVLQPRNHSDQPHHHHQLQRRGAEKLCGRRQYGHVPTTTCARHCDY